LKKEIERMKIKYSSKKVLEDNEKEDEKKK
jgi:hypothetical protein